MLTKQCARARVRLPGVRLKDRGEG
jgi:hypothetical protein